MAPKDPDSFGFEVDKYHEPIRDERGDLQWDDHGELIVDKTSVPTWGVSLPHQCSEWDIAGYKNGGEGVPHADAVALFAEFIHQAEVAFAELGGGLIKSWEELWALTVDKELIQALDTGEVFCIVKVGVKRQPADYIKLQSFGDEEGWDIYPAAIAVVPGHPRPPFKRLGIVDGNPVGTPR